MECIHEEEENQESDGAEEAPGDDSVDEDTVFNSLEESAL